VQPNEYRKMAEVEDRMWYYRALHRHVARCLITSGLPPDAEVLDAGCGTGGLLRHLHFAQPAWTLSGLDFSALACVLARERTGAAVTEGSVTRLPFADGSFSAVTSCDVLCQLERPDEALREFVRCLRPGGVVLLTMPAYQWLYSYHDRQVANLRRYSAGETKELLQTAGLKPIYNSYWNTLPFPLAVLRRKIFFPADPTSDVRLYPAPLEAMFNAMMAIEHAWLSAGGRLPYGSSVLVVARKPDHA
jgi:ubiquinone/menaquinone biosynthesis C-methylase UbiE